MKSKLLLFILLFTSQINAQVKQTTKEISPSSVENLDQLVDLTPDQKVKATAIYKDSEQKEKSVQANSSLSADAKIIELEKIQHDETVAIGLILDPTQKEKLNDHNGSEPQKANINTSRSNIKQEN